MNAMRRAALMLAMAGALSMPTALLAADAAVDEHAGHHPEPAQEQAATPPAQARAATLRERMLEIRATKDPDRRKQLMDAQMKDMEAMMQDGSCPGMAGGKPGMAMMGPGPGMAMMGGRGCMGGKCGMGMMDVGMTARHDMMEKRMDMLEKRMDMMQLLIMMRINMDRPGR